MKNWFALLLLSLYVMTQSASLAVAQVETKSLDPWSTGVFQWIVSKPVLSIDATKLPPSEAHPWVAVKDPSIIQHEGRWHLFCSLRKLKQGDGRIRIGHLVFDDWAGAREATWTVMNLATGYHGAPQVFYFTPHKKWYLVYQAEDDAQGLKYGPCYSTTENIDDPASWTLPKPMYLVRPGANPGLDFWVICDEQRAHLFFTTLDGCMWRTSTSIHSFPDTDWSEPQVALQADIFEASHTYKLLGREQYLTLVEAQADNRRYFKAFVAARLDGEWKPLAATSSKPFVSLANVVNQQDSWATSYSHGEFLRTGYNERLEIDPTALQLLFQGANDEEYRQGHYGQIPWRLGLLTPAVSNRDPNNE